MQELRLPIYWAAQQIAKKIGGRDPSVLFTHPETCQPTELAPDKSLIQLGTMTLADYDAYMRSQPRYFDFDKQGRDIVIYTGRRAGATTLAQSLVSLLPQSLLVTAETQRNRFRGVKIETIVVDYWNITTGNLQGLRRDHPKARFVLIASGVTPTDQVLVEDSENIAVMAIPTFHVANCFTPDVMANLLLKYPEDYQVTVCGPSARLGKPAKNETPDHIIDLVKFADKTLRNQGFDLETVLREVRR